MKYPKQSREREREGVGVGGGQVVCVIPEGCCVLFVTVWKVYLPRLVAKRDGSLYPPVVCLCCDVSAPYTPIPLPLHALPNNFA